MTLFTDPMDAINDATKRAQLTGESQSLVLMHGRLTVLATDRARIGKFDILETVNPTWEAA